MRHTIDLMRFIEGKKKMEVGNTPKIFCFGSSPPPSLLLLDSQVVRVLAPSKPIWLMDTTTESDDKWLLTLTQPDVSIITHLKDAWSSPAPFIWFHYVFFLLHKEDQGTREMVQ